MSEMMVNQGYWLLLVYLVIKQGKPNSHLQLFILNRLHGKMALEIFYYWMTRKTISRMNKWLYLSHIKRAAKIKYWRFICPGGFMTSEHLCLWQLIVLVQNTAASHWLMKTTRHFCMQSAIITGTRCISTIYQSGVCIWLYEEDVCGMVGGYMFIKI